MPNPTLNICVDLKKKHVELKKKYDELRRKYEKLKKRVEYYDEYCICDFVSESL